MNYKICVVLFLCLGYKYYDLITNETALQQYLTDLLGLAPEYAEAITLSGVKDVLVVCLFSFVMLSDLGPVLLKVTIDPSPPIIPKFAVSYLLCTYLRLISTFCNTGPCFTYLK